MIPASKALDGCFVVLRIVTLVVWSCALGRFVEVVQDSPDRDNVTSPHRAGPPRPP